MSKLYSYQKLHYNDILMYIPQSTNQEGSLSLVWRFLTTFFTKRFLSPQEALGCHKTIPGQVRTNKVCRIKQIVWSKLRDTSKSNLEGLARRARNMRDNPTCKSIDFGRKQLQQRFNHIYKQWDTRKCIHDAKKCFHYAQ